MGLNTIHDYSDDYMESYNITQQCTIRGDVLNSVDYSKIEKVSGLADTKFSAVIRVNGWANVNVGDKVKTPLNDRIYIVVRILDAKDNKLLFKRRKDIQNFTGSCDVFLE